VIIVAFFYFKKVTVCILWQNSVLMCWCAYHVATRNMSYTVMRLTVLSLYAHMGHHLKSSTKILYGVITGCSPGMTFAR